MVDAASGSIDALSFVDFLPRGTRARNCGTIPQVSTPYLEARQLPSVLPSPGRIYVKGGFDMAVSKERKAELVAQYGKGEKDSGSAEVQVALLTERIKGLTEHMKVHPKDFHTRRGLLMLVGKRRRLLSYIKARNIEEYRALIKSLGIRDNIQ